MPFRGFAGAAFANMNVVAKNRAHILVLILSLALLTSAHAVRAEGPSAETIDSLARDMAADIQQDPYLRDWYLSPAIGAPPPPIPESALHGSGVHVHRTRLHEGAEKYIRSNQYVTLGEGSARYTYVIPGVTDPTLAEAFVRLQPDEQARFALVRRIVLVNLIKKLHPQVRTMGILNATDQAVKVEAGLAMKLVKRLIARVRGKKPKPLEMPTDRPIVDIGKVKWPPPRIVTKIPNRDLEMRGHSEIQEILELANTQLVRRCDLVGRSNEHGGAADIGININLGLGPINFLRRPAIGIVSARRGKGGHTLDFYRATQTDPTSGFPVSVGFAADAQFSYFIRRVDADQPPKLKEGKTNHLPSPISGVHLFTFDYEDGFALGVRTPVPFADLLAGGVGALMHTIGSAKWVSRLVSLGSGTLDTASGLVKEETPTKQRALLRLIWRRGQKIPQIQMGKRRISADWLRAMLRKKGYCPMAELVTPPDSEESKL